MVYLFIFLGGGIGAVARFGLSTWMNKTIIHIIPFGTATVNILGSFVIGFLFAFMDGRETDFQYWRQLFIVGFLGGFTTFSSFSWEALVLFREGNYLECCIYILTNVVLSLAGVFAGFALGKSV